MNQPKQVCKNIASGKYFLFIEETNDEKLLLVIPMGEVKSLDSFLFEDIEEVDITDILNNGIITQQQIDGYKKFVEEDSIRLFKEIMRSVEDAEDLLEKLKIAQKRMSRVQYEFAINRLAESVRSTGN
jgi:hypothetical protein